MDATDRLKDFPAPDDFKQALENTLRENKEIDNITFSGNGEPTLHPRFEELVDITKQLRDEYFPSANIGVLSNSTMVNVEKVRRALNKLDFRIMKLDAGDLANFRKINRPGKAVDYEAIVSGLKSLEKVTLQTMFVDGTIQNIGHQEVDEWIRRVGEIRPIKAQIYSLHRPPAESTLQEVSAEKLKEIAARAEQATGVVVEVIIAKQPYRRRTSSEEPGKNTGS
jgi:wyosine [tRNA(Phe)-imidazoG37] synthetase (radical SAM superfamily)